MFLSIKLENKNLSSYYSEIKNVFLYNGDCIDLLNVLPDQSVQLILTSPPYNIGKEYESHKPFKDYITWQDSIIELCIKKLKNTGSICWQVGNYIDRKNNNEILPLDIYLYHSFKSRGMNLRNRVIWHFGHGLHASKRFSGRYETIMWFSKSNEYVFNLDPIRVPQKYPGKKAFKGPRKGELSGNPLGKNPSDVWEISNVKHNHVEKTAHPCQFPMELVTRLILSLTNPNDLVFDPFMGVGTTQASAALNNRKSIGSELNEDYYNVAIERVKAAYNGTLFIRRDKTVFDANSFNLFNYMDH